MKKLTIDPGDLIFALEDHDQAFAWFLDTETGEVVSYSQWDPIKEEKEIRERVEAGGDRYLEIEPLSSHEGFRFMEDFIDTLPDGEAARELWDSLDGSRPFRRFKDTLTDYPEVREQWFRYQERRQLAYAADWLHVEGIEPEWRVPEPDPDKD